MQAARTSNAKNNPHIKKKEQDVFVSISFYAVIEGVCSSTANDKAVPAFGSSKHPRHARASAGDRGELGEAGAGADGPRRGMTESCTRVSSSSRRLRLLSASSTEGVNCASFCMISSKRSTTTSCSDSLTISGLRGARRAARACEPEPNEHKCRAKQTPPRGQAKQRPSESVTHRHSITSRANVSEHMSSMLRSEFTSRMGSTK